MRATSSIVIFVVGSFFGVRLVFAAPAEDARDQTKKAAAAYNLGGYEDAARGYEAAYKLVQDPTLLFNVGQSWRLAGKPDRAIVAYKSYLRTAPLSALNREQVERRVVELEQLLASSKNAQVAPPPAGSLPEAHPPKPTTSVVPLTTGQPVKTPPPPFVSLTAAQSLDPAPPIYRQWWFWTGVGAVVAGVATTAVLLSSGSGRSTTCGAGVDFCAPVLR